MENLLWCTVTGSTTGPSTSIAPWCTWVTTRATASGCRWHSLTCASASAAGWVWRQEAWYLKEVSAVAQRLPRRSVRFMASASSDIPAAMPCAPSKMRSAPVKPSWARYADIRPAAAACAVCNCLESAAVRRNSQRPADWVPAEPKAWRICWASRLQQVADRGRRGQRAGRAGGVEHLVVRAAEEFADADADLVARDARGQQLLAAGAQRLGDGDRGGKHHRRRMEHGAVVHVVLLGEVRGGVRHGREIGSGSACA